MMYAKDFRERARMALQNNWLWAVLTGLVASLLGACVTLQGNGGSSSSSDTEQELEQLEASGINVTELLSDPIMQATLAVVGIFFLIVVVWAIACFIIGGPVTLGYAKYNLNLVDGNNPQFSDLFSKFDCFGQGFCVQFLRGLFVFLWSLLFIIPGIVKNYSYSMAAYIAAENPDMSATDCITESRKLMDGNKGRFFCLNLSFIGWAFLCVFTLGIGYLFLKPYMEASYAAFYREIVRERTPYVAPEQSVSQDNPYFTEF
ncbi:MAG: DUF975 family protein [Lachnospiraceae bacterium]|nr:DUF975 family protein [Lachnospiraceae bacterium]